MLRSLADDGMAADWTREMVAIVIVKSCMFGCWWLLCWELEKLMLEMENCSLFILQFHQINRSIWRQRAPYLTASNLERFHFGVLEELR